MIYSDLTVEELKNLNKEHLVVLFPIGAIEQHGPHLPLGTDSYIAETIAKKIESKAPDKIVLLPTLFYGVSGSYGGSLDVDNRVFEELLMGIAKSVLNNGFRKMFFLNGHGGNQSYLEDVIASLNVEYPYAATIPLYLSGKRGIQALKKVNFKYWVRHADEIETSLIMAMNEKLVRKDKIIDETGLLKTKDYKPLDEGTLKLFLPWEYESISGVYGEPSKASKETGEFLLEEATEEILDIINQFEKITQKIEKIISQKEESNNNNTNPESNQVPKA